MAQTSFRTTKEQNSMLEKAKILLEVIEGKSYTKKGAILRIHERFLIDYYQGGKQKRIGSHTLVPVAETLKLEDENERIRS